MGGGGRGKTWARISNTFRADDPEVVEDLRDFARPLPGSALMPCATTPAPTAPEIKEQLHGIPAGYTAGAGAQTPRPDPAFWGMAGTGASLVAFWLWWSGPPGLDRWPPSPARPRLRPPRLWLGFRPNGGPTGEGEERIRRSSRKLQRRTLAVVLLTHVCYTTKAEPAAKSCSGVPTPPTVGPWALRACKAFAKIDDGWTAEISRRAPSLLCSPF